MSELELAASEPSLRGCFCCPCIGYICVCRGMWSGVSCVLTAVPSRLFIAASLRLPLQSQVHVTDSGFCSRWTVGNGKLKLATEKKKLALPEKKTLRILSVWKEDWYPWFTSQNLFSYPTIHTGRCGKTGTTVVSPASHPSIERREKGERIKKKRREKEKSQVIPEKKEMWYGIGSIQSIIAPIISKQKLQEQRTRIFASFLPNTSMSPP